MLPPTRRRLRRFHDDEDGAVLLIVVFALVAMVGMLVLVVDLGSLVSTRRAAVTAADAAALAAAQSCFDGDAAGAPVAAQQLGLANLENSGTSLSGTTSTIVAQQGCGTSREYGYVTVKVATNQDLYFASDLRHRLARRRRRGYGGVGNGGRTARAGHGLDRRPERLLLVRYPRPDSG